MVRREAIAFLKIYFNLLFPSLKTEAIGIQKLKFVTVKNDCVFFFNA